LGNFAAWEGAGPGGAGGGGSISFTSGTPVQNVSGGTAGTTNSDHLTEFNMNGATNGASGLSGNTTTIFNLTAVNTEVCAGQSASFSVSASGTLPGTVNWYASAFGGSSLGTGLTYTPSIAPTVTTTYYAGICPGTFRVPVTVTVNPLPVVTGTAVLTNPTCSTAGSITGLSVSSGTTPYQYYWNGVSNPTVNYTNLASGTYSFTVTDSKGCTASSGPYTLTGVAGPIIDASGVIVQNVNCVGDPGSITGITASGTGLNYLWSNSGGSALDASGLAAGSYTLTVTDANSCTSSSGPYTVNVDTGPTIDQSSVSVVDEHCSQADGAISGIVTTGSSPIYSWNGTTSTTADLIGVSAGTYTLTVTDIGGCTVSGAPITVANTPGPSVDIASVIITNENCTASDGAISGVVPSGGTPAYTYSWNGVTASTLDVSGVSAGVYSITVTDFYGCTVTSAPITVGTAPGPSLDESAAVVTDVQCNGSLGTISGITATGSNMTYSWSNSGGSTLDVTGLLPNTYILTATDEYGCSVTSSPYTVGAVTPLLINSASMTVTPTACTSNTGSISGIIVIGGISPSSSWSSGQSSLNISNLTAGVYTLTVNDNQNCSATLSVTIDVSPDPNISLVSSQDITCAGDNNGAASVAGSGGTGTLSYSWQPGGLTGLSQSALPADAYIVTVTDQNGCTNTVSFSISEPAPIVVSQGSISPANCGSSDGSASVTASGGTGTLNYSWSPVGGNTSTASSIPGGNYTVTVSDDNACTAALNLVVNSLGGPVVTVSDQTDVTCNGESDGSVTVNATGGTVPYQFNWSPSGGAQATASGLDAGSYTVVVTDDAGCVGSISVTISEPALLTVTSDVTPTDCGSSTGSITLNASGGTAPYSYGWSSGSGSTSSVTGLSSGTYTATITDALGCTVTAVNNVTATGSLTLTVSPDVASIGPGQSVTLSASGAETYTWTPENGLSCIDCPSPVASPSETTSYIVSGTTSDGCTGTTIVQVIVIEDCGEIYVPTVFAPNGTSGKLENQRFGIFGQCIASVSIEVYDRWGNKVYEYSPENPYWDGKYKGEELNSGVYVYQLSVTTTDQKTTQMSGNVTLMR
jgi:gliding motility-associated-like protein